MSAGTAGKGMGQKRGKQGRAATASGLDCPACGADNQAGSRFCRHCGRSLSGDGGGWLNAQTLTVLGAAVLCLVALGLLFSSVIDTGPGAPPVPAATRTTSTASGQPPDLSTMSPREAADRLFNRVMIADEQGNDGEVEQFAPMAVAAYDQLESMDLDAIYHVGLIQAAAGNAAAAAGAIERLRAVVPNHLLATLLDYRLATDANDQTKAERAIERFKSHYEDEIQVDRREYREHRPQIDIFRKQTGLTGG